MGRCLLVLLFPIRFSGGCGGRSAAIKSCWPTPPRRATTGRHMRKSCSAWLARPLIRSPIAASAAVGIWESSSQLSRRIAMLLDENFQVEPSAPRRWRYRALGLLAILGAACSLVTLQPGRSSGEPPPDSGAPDFVRPILEAKTVKYKSTVEMKGPPAVTITSEEMVLDATRSRSETHAPSELVRITDFGQGKSLSLYPEAKHAMVLKLTDMTRNAPTIPRPGSACCNLPRITRIEAPTGVARGEGDRRSPCRGVPCPQQRQGVRSLGRSQNRRAAPRRNDDGN